jgi:flagellar basal body-associated protein FliL
MLDDSIETVEERECNIKPCILFIIQIAFLLLNILADVIIVYWFFTDLRKSSDEAVARMIRQAKHLRMH